MRKNWKLGVLAGVLLGVVSCSNPTAPSRGRNRHDDQAATDKTSGVHTIKIQVVGEAPPECRSGYSVATGRNGEIILVCNDE